MEYLLELGIMLMSGVLLLLILSEALEGRLCFLPRLGVELWNKAYSICLIQVTSKWPGQRPKTSQQQSYDLNLSLFHSKAQTLNHPATYCLPQWKGVGKGKGQVKNLGKHPAEDLVHFWVRWEPGATDVILRGKNRARMFLICLHCVWYTLILF